ncbi:MAG: 50S ribosomal protein L4, partial [Candidatus Nomurabacteria bacterium GW2011_GWF2_43_8]
MAEAKIYNQKGAETGTISLPDRVFAAKWRSDLVHQVVESMRSNKRAGTADTKDRGEVRGGGSKPWKQKGTGRARHGSSRSPIWVGGGVTHGPLAEKNYKRKISKKMRAQALFSVLSKKLKDGEIIFIDSLSLSGIKTKNALKV